MAAKITIKLPFKIGYHEDIVRTMPKTIKLHYSLSVTAH